MATAEFKTVEDHLTRDELRALLDSAARESLGIPGDEFVEKLKTGELDEFEPKIAHLAVLARFLTD